MAFTHDDLLNAIRDGQIKGGGSPEEIAREIERRLEEERANRVGQRQSVTAPPPAAVITPPKNAPDAPGTLGESSATPETPREPPGPRLVIPSSDAEFAKALVDRAQQNRPTGIRPVRLRSLIPGYKPSQRATIEEAIRFLEENAPLRLTFQVDFEDEHGVSKRTIIVDRNINALPGMGGSEQGRMDYLKLCYRHPGMDETMEVSHLISVQDIATGLDMERVLEKLKTDLGHTYRQRPKDIEPVVPPIPRLTWNPSGGFGLNAQEAGDTPESQDEIANAVKSGKVDQLVKRIRGEE